MTKTESAVFVVGAFDVQLAQQKGERQGAQIETAGLITFALPQNTVLFDKATSAFRVTFVAEGERRKDAYFAPGDSSWNCELSVHSLAAWVATLASPLQKELRLESGSSGAFVNAYLLASGGR